MWIFRQGIEVWELEFVFNGDTSESVSVATEDCNEVVLFKLGEGVGAGLGIYEVLTDPFKVGYSNSCCITFANFLIIGGVEKVVGQTASDVVFNFHDTRA